MNVVYCGAFFAGRGPAFRPFRGRLSRSALHSGLLTLALLQLTAIPGGAATPVTALVFSPDGQHLIVGRERVVEVRSAASLEIERALDPALQKVTSVAFHPNGAVLAVGGGEPGKAGGAVFFDWPDGNKLSSAQTHADLVSQIAFDTAGTRLAMAGADGLVELRSWPGHKLFRELKGHAGPVQCVAFSPDASLVLSAGRDRSVKVWKAAGSELIRSFSHHTETINCIAIRPKGSAVSSVPVPFQCATGSDDKTVRIWQPAIGRMVRIVRGHEGPVFALAYSADGTQLFSGGKEGVIRVIEGDSDQVLHQWQAHEDWIYSLAISPDGKRLVSGDWKGSVRLWAIDKQPAVLVGESK